MRIESLLAVLLATASPAAAGEILVPGDQPTLCQAIEAAAPGDVIRVQTAVEQFGCPLTGDGLVIDKPLTILGDPVCNIGLGHFEGVLLDGPGSGAVTLVDVELAYSFDSDGRRGLVGSGFDELHLYRTRVDQLLPFPTGLIGQSHPAIDVTIPLVVLVESFVRGGNAGSDHCSGPTFYIDGATGLHAPGSTVVLLDSEVHGGNGEVSVGGCCISDCGCSPAWPGRGGTGLVAAELYASSSTVAGGRGATWTSYPGGTPDNPSGVPTECAPLPDGADMVVSGTTQLLADADLTSPSIEVRLGGLWHFTWRPPLEPGCANPMINCRGLLVGDFSGLRDPMPLHNGLLFLDRSTAILIKRLPFLPEVNFTVHVPPSLTLIGTKVTTQVLGPRGRFSRPVTGILLP